jgi:prefoldin subunit 5
MMQLINWVTELENWVQELNSWQTQISSLQNQLTNLGLNPTGLKQLTAADKTNLVNDTCPGPNPLSGVMQAITQVLSNDANANIAQRQQAICQQIVQLQIDKYDRSVDMLNRINGGGSYGSALSQIQGTLGALSAAIGGSGNGQNSSIMNTLTSMGQQVSGLGNGQTLSSLAGSGSSGTSGLGSGQNIADLTSQMNTTQQNMAGLEAEMKTYLASINVDDAAISSLQTMQTNLANIALKGSHSQSLISTVTGQFVKAAAFNAVLDNIK